uniref:RNA-directed DNA polymerase, eukaryota n=1 Tax=Tanacetum cinerariifolium TaxID=118510 RepID=A0A6L2NW61_TANCI|nr:RNA-directed DNA polymerase, eukaryota [Tanacetum cinerariifolium]
MSLMGREKDAYAIPNLPCIIVKEGFQNVKLSYLGGMWVRFEFDSLASKEKFLNHSGIGSWFTELIQETSSFDNDKRIVWISIECLPIKAWNPNTFLIINERQKVIIKGKVYWIRVKELDAWFSKFQEDDQDDLSSDGESQEGDIANKADNNESDVDRVSESSFMHKNDTAHKDVNSCKNGEVGSHSEDPFNIYGILNGQKNNVCNSCSDEPKFPPGFTPDNNDQEKIVEENIKDTTERVQSLSNKLNDCCSNREFSSQRSMNSHSQKSKVGLGNNANGDGLKSYVRSIDLILPLFKKLALKIAINAWSKEANKRSNDRKINIQQNLSEVDKLIDQRKSNDEILIKRITLFNYLQELNNRNAMEISQKAKIRWSIEGDENSKYFHGIMNKKRSQLAIRRTLANGEWISEPHGVKNDFFTHFKKQFSPIQAPSICFDFTFLTRLSSDQVQDLERTITYEDVKRAVWDCGTNKSPGTDGFSFEFYFNPTLEFQFHKGLKQDDTISLFLSILIMETLHLTFKRVLNSSLYKGISLNDSFTISHLFYADDVVFIGIGVSSNVVAVAASLIGCSILTVPFNYLGVKAGSNMSRITSWDNVISKDVSWLGEVALKVLYKRLYALEMCKSISVAEKMGHPSLSHSFSMMPRGGVEQENYGLLCSKVADLVLPHISDRWCWYLEGSQEFSVKSSRISIDNTILPKAEFPTRWLKIPEHRRMILESVEHGPLIWPTIEELVTRTKKYDELFATEKIQADCDLKATKIILHGLPSDIYLLVNHRKVAKDLWERIQLLMQGTSLIKQDRECKLYDAFDKFAHIKGESLHQYYLRFTQLINDMNIYKMKLEHFQVNTKFVNSLQPEWSKFMTDVKLVKDLHTTNFDQLHAYLQQHELYTNKVRIMCDASNFAVGALLGQKYGKTFSRSTSQAKLSIQLNKNTP